MKTNYLYQELARLCEARHNCIKSNNQEWLTKHTDRILNLVESHFPSGSGFDCGTKIDLDESHGEKLVFTTSFRHMNDGGYYDGWTEHTITVTGSLHSGFKLSISGRNRNDIKEYIHESFEYALHHAEWNKEEVAA